MNPKTLLIFALIASIAVNVALLIRKPAPSAPAAAAPAPSGSPAKPAADPSARTIVLTNTLEKSFDWRQVESGDYKKYIANLRAIGCPEKTIRDIIAADVNELFKEREKQSRAASTNKFAFWKTGMQMFAQAFDEEKIKQQQELKNEKRALLTELLGSAPEEKPDLAAAMGGANLVEQMLDFLPADKQSAVADVIQKYQAKMMKDLGKGGFDADSMKDIARIQKEMEGELAKFLSPQQVEEYNLRMSNTANMMRFQLASFEPNEQEFRDLFRYRKPLDDEFGFTGVPPTDTAEKEKFDAAKKAMNDQLRQVLGDRYPDYERSQDYAYQTLYAVAERNGLPKETTVQVYGMKQAAEAQAKRLRGDTALSTDQRQTALQAVASETERAMRAAMGDKAFEAYKKNPGAYWLKNLSAGPRPPTPTGK